MSEREGTPDLTQEEVLARLADAVGGDVSPYAALLRVVHIPPERFGTLRPLHRPEAVTHPGAFADRKWPQYRMEFYTKWSFSDRERVYRLNQQAAAARPHDDVGKRVSDTIEEITGYSFGHFLLDSGCNHQTDPRVLAERVWNPDPEPPKRLGREAYRERIDRFERRAVATWTCLLSIFTDDLLRPVVDSGLSFLIRKSDLAERRFDRPWIARS